jgi:hypothetical protein
VNIFQELADLMTLVLIKENIIPLKTGMNDDDYERAFLFLLCLKSWKFSLHLLSFNVVLIHWLMIDLVILF